MAGALLVLISLVCFAQDIEIKKPAKPSKPSKPAPAPPRKPTPVVPAIGELSVVTTPSVASVIIKDAQGNVVSEGQSKEGTYQAKLPPGEYTILVTADRYLQGTFQGKVEPAKLSVLVRAQLAPAFGSILINLGRLGPDATILIDGKKPERLTRGEQNRVQIEDVRPGSHKLRITHPSIASFEQAVEVTGGITAPVNPDFIDAKVNLTVKSEPLADIYVDGIFEGKTTESRELRIADKYKPGSHSVRAEKAFFEPVTDTRDMGIGDVVVEVKLTRIKSSPEFSESFNDLTGWNGPASWQVNQNRLSVRGSDVGLLQNKNYIDFKATLSIGFTNGKGAVWILRARDKKNYYLFQLCGPKGASKNVFRSYLYQNGQRTTLQQDNILDDMTRPGDQYTITIEAKGSTIKHYIEIKSNPKAKSQVFSTVVDSTIGYGTIGLGSIEGEEFVVYSVIVLPDQSTSR